MNRAFYFLLTGQSFSNIAGAFYTIVITTLVYHATESAILASLITLVRAFSIFLSSFIVPLLIDRLKLRTIIISAQIGQLFFLVFMRFLLNMEQSSFTILFLFLLIFAISSFDGLAIPSRNALLPQLVDKEKLVRGNGLMSTSDQSLALLSWTFGGLLVVTIGERNVLWITLLFQLLSTLAISLIPKENVLSESSVKPPLLDSIKEGWIALFGSKNTRIVAMMDIIEGIAGGIWIGGITLVFVKQVLVQGEEWWGYINASYYIGTILGGFLIIALSAWLRQRLLFGIIIGSFGVSILVFLYSLNTIPLLALVLVVLMGPFYQLRDVAQRTFFQSNVALHQLPKVYSVQGMLGYFMLGISVFLMGTISDLLGAKMVYVIAAIFYLVSSTLAFLLRSKSEQVI